MNTKRPLNKTNSLTNKIKRSSSSLDPNPHHQNPQKTSDLIEYPTSPQLIFGREIPHFSHPQHPLAQADLPDLFTCAGCKEYGSGKRFTCRQCDFQLHEFCALAPESLKSHPFHIQHRLLFNAKPVKGGMAKSKCDMCAKPTKGYIFRCSACTYQMHPCCAMLSNEINISTHPHTLKILPLNSQNISDTGAFCGECNKRRSGRAYRCGNCNYHLHVVCAKNMVNGLQANGIKGPEKPSMFGTAAHLASQVVIEFIGGLIEGLGEGVGQALITSVARGTRTRRNTQP